MPTTDTQTAVALAPVREPSAFTVIERALSNGATPETVGAMLALRREYEADEGRKAFHLAIAAFQSRAPIIEKADKAYDKQYARMDRIWREVRPITSDLGLSVTWQKCELREGGLCHVEGSLGHSQGHSVALSMDVPIPDLIKGQNKAQQMGSAFTYAQRYAFCAALGIVTGDDDDGHAAGAVFVTDEQAREIAEKIDACRGLADFNEAAFWKWAGVSTPQEIAASRFNDVIASLIRKLKAPAK
jgi:hypothetical protein